MTGVEALAMIAVAALTAVVWLACGPAFGVGFSAAALFVISVATRGDAYEEEPEPTEDDVAAHFDARARQRKHRTPQ